MNCLLCDDRFHEPLSWRTLLLQRFPASCCTRCYEQFEHAVPNEDVEALFTYNDAMKDFMKRYKFMKDAVLANVFRNELHRALYKRHETIVPVPLHRERLYERTFSQVELLLEAARIPYVQLLKKEIHDTQSKKTLRERQNSEKRFTLRQQIDVIDKSFLIVDDIYTTGATLNEIKQLLLSHGAKKVSCFVLAKVKNDEYYRV